MVNVVSRTFPLDLMMKSVHFQVKKRLSFELQNVAVGLSSAVGLSAYPPLSAASECLAQRRI